MLLPGMSHKGDHGGHHNTCECVLPEPYIVQHVVLSACLWVSSKQKVVQGLTASISQAAAGRAAQSGGAQGAGVNRPVW